MPVSKGPLAVRWGAPPNLAPQAGAVAVARVELENAGSVAWRSGVNVAYHWLHSRDNPIVWDGKRPPAPPLRPGERTSLDVPVRAPIPPGPYRLALDMVAENRAWFSELGSPMLTIDLEVAPRAGEPHADLPAEVEPSREGHDHRRRAHAHGDAGGGGAPPGGGAARPRRRVRGGGGLRRVERRRSAPTAPDPRALRAGRRPRPRLRCAPRLPLGAPGHRAGAPRRRRRPTRVRRPSRRAVDLRRT